MITVNSVKTTAKKKMGAVLLFTYGIVLGTSAPLLLARCSSAGGCGGCGGLCSTAAAIGIVPLVLGFVFKNKVKQAGRSFLGLFHKP
jgi:MinD superfamily P-loop ATPase